MFLGELLLEERCMSQSGRCEVRRLMLHRGEEVCSGPDRRVQDDYVVVGEVELLVKARPQQFGYERDLAFDHGRRREVDAALLAESRIVGCEEVLVEVEPDVPPSGPTRDLVGVDGRDRSLEKLDRSLDLPPCRRICEHTERLG